MKRRLFQILGVAAVATVGMVSCTDACKDVECGTWGICVEGDCVCDDGYEGTNCETLETAKFAATYLASGTVICPVTGDVTLTNETLTIAASSTDVTRITIDLAGEILLTAVVDGTNLVVDAVTIDGFDYTGTGSISGNILTLTLNEVETGVETCIYNLTCVKQ